MRDVDPFQLYRPCRLKHPRSWHLLLTEIANNEPKPILFIYIYIIFWLPFMPSYEQCRKLLHTCSSSSKFVVEATLAFPVHACSVVSGSHSRWIKNSLAYHSWCNVECQEWRAKGETIAVLVLLLSLWLRGGVPILAWATTLIIGLTFTGYMGPWVEKLLGAHGRRRNTHKNARL